MLRTKTTGKVVGRIALVVAILLSASPAQGFPGQPSPAVQLVVAHDARSEKLVCLATYTAPPSGRGQLTVQIKVPTDATLNSALLKTTSGELALDVVDAAALVGEYATIIDSERANCAPSGVLVLDVEGEFGTSTTSCPEIPLFDPHACDASSSANR